MMVSNIQEVKRLITISLHQDLETYQKNEISLAIGKLFFIFSFNDNLL